jgi:hypothetical protein
MRLTRKAAIAGLAPLVLAGAAWAAEKPAKPEVSIMEVVLPGGGVARIAYSGDVAPRILVGSPRAAALPAGALPARFAEMDRIMAEMNRRAALMMRQMELRMAAMARAGAAGLEPDARGMRWVSLPGFGTAAGVALPPGAVSYSSVTRVVGGRSCTETVQVTHTSADAAPQVVRRTSGDCGAAGAAPATRAPAARTIAAEKPARPAAPPPRPDEVI